MIRNIRRYLEGCDLYQRIKNLTETLAWKLTGKTVDTLNEHNVFYYNYRRNIGRKTSKTV